MLVSPLGLPVQSGMVGWKTALGRVQSNTEADGRLVCPPPPGYFLRRNDIFTPPHAEVQSGFCNTA